MAATYFCINKHCAWRTYIRLVALSCCWIFTISGSEGASVDLRVRDGISLVGEICPGIVTLECDTVDTNQLRWRYNNTITIEIYFADNSPSRDTPSQTFPSVELTAISRNGNRANYSSTLTADLSLLQSDHITDLECGDAASFVMLPVAVEIIQRSPPRNPSIVMVTADYQSEGQLDSVTVEWRKSTNYCPDYGLNFTYQVNISSESSTMVEHDSTAESCITEFDNIGTGNDQYYISILASNELGNSDLVLYPYVINHFGQNYFRPRVFDLNDMLVIECISSTINVAGSHVCSVRYTTNSSYTGLSDPFTTTLDEPLDTGLNSDSNVTYYFEFSLLINNSLTIIAQTNFTRQMISTGTPDNLVAIIVPLVIIIALIIIASIIIVIIVLAVGRRKHYNMKKPISNLSSDDGNASIDETNIDKKTDATGNDPKEIVSSGDTPKVGTKNDSATSVDPETKGAEKFDPKNGAQNAYPKEDDIPKNSSGHRGLSQCSPSLGEVLLRNGKQSTTECTDGILMLQLRTPNT